MRKRFSPTKMVMTKMTMSTHEDMWLRVSFRIYVLKFLPPLPQKRERRMGVSKLVKNPGSGRVFYPPTWAPWSGYVTPKYGYISGHPRYRVKRRRCKPQDEDVKMMYDHLEWEEKMGGSNPCWKCSFYVSWKTNLQAIPPTWEKNEKCKLLNSHA